LGCGFKFRLDFGLICSLRSGFFRGFYACIGFRSFSFTWFGSVSACLTFRGAVMTTLGVAALHSFGCLFQFDSTVGLGVYSFFFGSGFPLGMCAVYSQLQAIYWVGL
jgi:hypothetical protein